MVPTNPSGTEDGGLYSIDVLDPDVYLPLNVRRIICHLHMTTALMLPASNSLVPVYGLRSCAKPRRHARKQPSLRGDQVLYYYRTGINALKSKGYVAGKNLHGMGFDFRCSMTPTCTMSPHTYVS